jgi:hypothetical protein
LPADVVASEMSGLEAVLTVCTSSLDVAATIFDFGTEGLDGLNGPEVFLSVGSSPSGILPSLFLDACLMGPEVFLSSRRLPLAKMSPMPGIGLPPSLPLPLPPPPPMLPFMLTLLVLMLGPGLFLSVGTPLAKMSPRLGAGLPSPPLLAVLPRLLGPGLFLSVGTPLAKMSPRLGLGLAVAVGGLSVAPVAAVQSWFHYQMSTTRTRTRTRAYTRTHKYAQMHAPAALLSSCVRLPSFNPLQLSIASFRSVLWLS